MPIDRSHPAMRTGGLFAMPLLLAGCAATHSASVGEIDPADFGEANRQTYAAMIINPDPQYLEPMSTSAEHAADAADRYRTDTVKQPEDVSTTQTVSE
jgi:type IV pilus biogenesis protein CpaD/CtpE